LVAIGNALGLTRTAAAKTSSHSIKESKPMVSGIRTFEKSLAQAVEDKVAADAGLSDTWQAVSSRFHLVYAQPEAAFRAVNVDALIKDPGQANAIIARIAEKPEALGPLKGKTGLLASRADRQDRDTALVNAPALARNLERYLEARNDAQRKYEGDEVVIRNRLAVDIPALSANAKNTLERIRDAIDRNDLPAGLEFALADKMVKAELEGFAKAVSERFGERTFLPLAAKDTSGKTFETLAKGMTKAQKTELQSSWPSLRTIQQLAAHERSTQALKQAETLRQTKSHGLSLK
jgi:hypothetical protein